MFEPPITPEEKAKSMQIRLYLADGRFNDIYKLCPKEIARKINEKYRVIKLEQPK